MKKIVFFGSSLSSRLCLNELIKAGYEISAVVTQPDRPSGRGKKILVSEVKKLALDQNLTIFQPEKVRKNPEFREQLEKISPDLNVVVAYGQIIPGSIIFLPKYNSINLHLSLLPHYRGSSPVQWAILQGAEKTGITIFELSKKMDEGPIYAHRELATLPGENAAELELRLIRSGAQLLLDTIPKIPDLDPVPQDHAAATYVTKLSKEDGCINWDQPALQIERQVRAFTPWPSTFTYWKNKRLKVIKGEVLAEKNCPRQKSGEILHIDKAGIAMCCQNGTIYLIKEVQPENKKIMPAFAFSIGMQLNPGDRFE